MEKEALEALLARGISVEKIAKRFGKDPSTISYWMKRYDLVSSLRGKHAAKGGIAREQLEELVDAGMTLARISEEVSLSKGAVRHWMRVYGLRTARAWGERAKVAKAAKVAGLLTVTMSCRHHGETEFTLEGRGYYRCRRCRAESVVRHRQKVKAILVQEAGGRCVACGYSRHIQVLQFHHRDPSEKRLQLSGQGVTYSLARLRAEARKCVLLCANCHVEVEIGATSLPLECLARPPISVMEG